MTKKNIHAKIIVKIIERSAFMKKNVWIIIVFFLAIVMAGCGAKTEKRKQTEEKKQIEEKKVSTYQTKPISLGSSSKAEKLQRYEKMKYIQETYYILSNKEKSAELLILNKDGNLINTIAFEKEKKTKAKDFCILENGEFCVLFAQSELESVVWYYNRYDETGNCLNHQEFGEYSIFAVWIAAGKECFLYDYDNKKFVLYGEDGKPVWEKTAGNLMFDTMMYGQDEYLYIITYGNNALRTILKVDSKTGKTEKELETDFTFTQVPELSWGENENEIYFCDEKKGLYCYNLEEKQSKQLIDWIESGIQLSGCNSICIWKNGFLCLSNQGEENGGLYEIVSGEEKEKLVLTIGTYYHIDYYTSEIVTKFNQEHEDIQLKIRDYSKYEEPTTQLQLDIASGDCPDILEASMIRSENLLKKGILIDLYSFMEEDKEMQPEQFVDSVLKTLEYDKGLYVLPMSFELQYFVFDKRLLSKEERKDDFLEKGISMELLERLSKKYSKKTVFQESYHNQISFLCHILAAGKIERFFSSEEMEEQFSKLLEFSKGLPKESLNQGLSDQEQVQKGNVLFWEREHVTSPLDETILYKTCYKKENYIFSAYPCMEKSGAIIGRLHGDGGACYGISASCKDKEAAWEFIRSFFTEEKQEELMVSLPIRKEALEKKLKEKQDINGKEVSMTKKERKRYLELINSAEYFSIFSGIQYDLENIVREEAAAYFADEKSLEETVALIKNRVNLYVNEQE